MPPGAVTTALLEGGANGKGAARGPRGLVRLFPWSDEAPEVVPVDAPVVLGRDDDCEARCLEESVSRRHARVEARGLLLEVSDLGSSNGTFVREGRVERPTLVRPGDLVRFGRCVYLAVVDAAVFSDWWAAASGEPLAGGPALAGVRDRIRRFASRTDAVLITGETGTGKEVAARELHRASGRPGPFVAVNCAAVPDHLFEDQFFGHRRGAFTGAERDESGFFRAADRGTILLDEVGELAPSSQAKLLRALETRQVVPLGTTRAEPVDLRVASATNRDLAAAVAAGGFRADLYARLRVLSLHLPPLRERPEDVAVLARRFLDGSRVVGIDHETLVVLVRYPWPANVRELRNVLAEAESAAADEGSEVISVRHLRSDVAAPAAVRHAGGDPAAPDERTLEVLAALRAHRGNVQHAAASLGLHRAQVYRVLRRTGQKADDFRDG